MFRYMDISADEGSAPSDNWRLQGAASQCPGPGLIASLGPSTLAPAPTPGTPGRKEGPCQLRHSGSHPPRWVKWGLVSPPLERGDGPPWSSVPTGLGLLGPLQTLPALTPHPRQAPAVPLLGVPPTRSLPAAVL